MTGNVTALRNPLGSALEVLRPVYVELADLNAASPDDATSCRVLLDRVRPVHQVVPVDFYLPGCPPPADRIRAVLEALLQGKTPHLDREQRFG